MQSQSTSAQVQLLTINSYNKQKPVIDNNGDVTDLYYNKHVFILFGRTGQGNDVCIKVTDFKPYFFLKMQDWSQEYASKLIKDATSTVAYIIHQNNNKFNDFQGLSPTCVTHSFVQKHDVNNMMKRTWFVKIEFNSLEIMRTFKNCLAKKLGKDVVAKLLYQYNVIPDIMFSLLTHINLSDWISITTDPNITSKIKTNPNLSNADLNYVTSLTNLKPIKNPANKMCPIKIVSYDIECVSHNYSFPEPSIPSNRLIQIGFIHYWHNKPHDTTREIFVLHDCNQIPDAVVHVFQDERELLLAYAARIHQVKPDVMIGFNTSDFDDRFIKSRLDLFDKLETINKFPQLKEQFYGYNKPLLFTIKEIETDQNIKITGDPDSTDGIDDDDSSLLDSNEIITSRNRFIINPDGSTSIGKHDLVNQARLTKDEIFKKTHRNDPDLFDKLKQLNQANQHTLLNKFLMAYSRVNTAYIMEHDRVDKPLTQFVTREMNSKGAGDNEFKIFNAFGITPLDCYKNIKGNGSSLESYTLDSVSSHYIREQVTKFKHNTQLDTYEIETAKLNSFEVGSYIQLIKQDNIINLCITKRKIQIKSITQLDNGKYILSFSTDSIDNDTLQEIEDILLLGKYTLMWTFAKDDMTHHLMKDYFDSGDPEKNKIIATYCLQDCRLDLLLLEKLEILINLISMARANNVPFPYIIYKGQGVKVFSSVLATVMEDDALFPVIEKIEGEKYKGAYVLQPIAGYYDDPVIVLDLTSLYPNNIIEYNISHETWIAPTDKFRDLEHYRYNTIEYLDKKEVKQVSTFREEIVTKQAIDRELKAKNVKRKDVEAYIKDNFKLDNGTYYRYGIIPKTVNRLLAKRIEANNLLKTETDPSKKALLNGRQIALKVTANSVYGQMGSTVSPIQFMDGANVTTALGREKIHTCKDIVEHRLDWGIHETNPDLLNCIVIYGDTDSIFANAYLKTKYPHYTDEQLVAKAIEIAKIFQDIINGKLTIPHSIKYEKVYFPFIIITKKKYTGNKYENDPAKFKFDMMGLSIKKRDFATVSKIIVYGVLKTILETNDMEQAFTYAFKTIKGMFRGEFPLNTFIMSKSLKKHYPEPWKVAHRVLADRIGQRDKGRKPNPGDRMQFIHIVPPIANTKQKVLQGETIETPDFIKQNNLKVDYVHYLEQIRKSLTQFLELRIDIDRINSTISNIIANEQRNLEKKKTINDFIQMAGGTQIPVFKNAETSEPLRNFAKKKRAKKVAGPAPKKTFGNFFN